MDKPPWEGMGGYTDIDSTTLPMIDAQTPTFMGVPLAQDGAALNGADAVSYTHLTLQTTPYV